MNLLARSIQRSPINRSLFATIQHCNSYATRTTTSTTPKTQQLTSPKFQKPSTFPQRIKKQVESLTTVWPKPKEIPFQSKVANTVNLIGHLTTPVKFETGKDGKDFAFTVISQENDNGKNSLLIPVVFEGDLAHTVSCHVKEKDCVFVSGFLSAETMRLSLGESFGKFHIVADNLNFVEGFKRVAVNKSVSGVKKESEKVVEVENDVEFNKKWKTTLEEAVAKTNKDLKIDYVDSVEMKTDFEKPRTQVVTGYGNGVGKSFERSTESVVKKKDGNMILDLWRDVVKNPLQWYDYRGHKANGLVKEKFPDFKQKGSGEGLWMSSAPSWILPGIQKLEFDVKEMTGAARFVQKEAGKGWGESSGVVQKEASKGYGESASVAQKESGKGKGELWKILVEDPSKWWDNRTAKRNPRAPDFKHKETGEGVWINKLPDWALAKLPPVRDSMQRS